jgi:benzylsuccinate synthase
MANCGECKNYFSAKNDPKIGDCVQRVVDPRQGYYKMKPAKARQDAGKCPDFVKR